MHEFQTDCRTKNKETGAKPQLEALAEHNYSLFIWASMTVVMVAWVCWLQALVFILITAHCNVHLMKLHYWEWKQGFFHPFQTWVKNPTLSKHGWRTVGEWSCRASRAISKQCYNMKCWAMMWRCDYESGGKRTRWLGCLNYGCECWISIWQEKLANCSVIDSVYC